MGDDLLCVFACVSSGLRLFVIFFMHARVQLAARGAIELQAVSAHAIIIDQS